MALQKISWWHEAVVDWELVHPRGALGECAEYFNVSQAWLSTLRNSDVFREYKAKRMKSFHDRVEVNVVDKLNNLAGITLDVLQERVEKNREAISIDAVANVAQLALKSLGFGVPKAPEPRNATATPTVNINVNVSPEVLSRARERMRTINQDATVVDVPMMEGVA